MKCGTDTCTSFKLKYLAGFTWSANLLGTPTMTNLYILGKLLRRSSRGELGNRYQQDF